MEEICGGCAVRDLHVAVLVLTVELLRGGEDARILVAQLQESLHPARAVLGALTVVTMRQTHDQARSLQPLDFSGCNELIDDALCVVGEITELSLPHDQSRRR